MLEHNTNRLFWTLASIIVGALLLTIGVKVFPAQADVVIDPLIQINKHTSMLGDPQPSTVLNATGKYEEPHNHIYTTNQDYYSRDNNAWRVNLWKLSLKKGHHYRIHVHCLDTPNKEHDGWSDALAYNEIHQNINAPDNETIWIGQRTINKDNTQTLNAELAPDHDMTISLGLTGARSAKHYKNFSIVDDSFKS